MELVGFIQFSPTWFSDDGDTIPPSSHFIYKDLKTSRLINTDGFRETWLNAVQPVYRQHRNYSSDRFYISSFDLKTNWRRIHPYRHCIYKWYRRVIAYAHSRPMKGITEPPILILRPSRMISQYQEIWRIFSEPEIEFRIFVEGVVDGHHIVRRIQRWFRRYRIMREIRQEVAFRPGNRGMQECKERFELMIKINPYL